MRIIFFTFALVAGMVLAVQGQDATNGTNSDTPTNQTNSDPNNTNNSVSNSTSSSENGTEEADNQSSVSNATQEDPLSSNSTQTNENQSNSTSDSGTSNNTDSNGTVSNSTENNGSMNTSSTNATSLNTNESANSTQEGSDSSNSTQTNENQSNSTSNSDMGNITDSNGTVSNTTEINGNMNTSSTNATSLNTNENANAGNNSENATSPSINEESNSTLADDSSNSNMSDPFDVSDANETNIMNMTNSNETNSSDANTTDSSMPNATNSINMTNTDETNMTNVDGTNTTDMVAANGTNPTDMTNSNETSETNTTNPTVQTDTESNDNQNATESEALCEFPGDLSGIWWSTMWGDVTFTDSRIVTQGNQQLTFECFARNEETGNFILRLLDSSFSSNEDENVLTCVKFNFRNNDNVQLQILTDRNDNRTGLEPIVLTASANESVEFEKICTATEDTILESDLLRKGREIEGALGCPAPLQGSFNVTYKGQTASNCPNGATMSSCEMTKSLVYNYTNCNGTQDYAGENKYVCISGGVNFVTTFRNSTEKNDFTPFACLVINSTDTNNSSSLPVVFNGFGCGDRWSVESSDRPEIAYTLDKNADCSDESDPDGGGNLTQSLVFTTMLALISTVIAHWL